MNEMRPLSDERAAYVIARIGLTLLLATAGGAIMWYFQMPLAWLLGAMAATGLGAIVGVPLTMPAVGRIPMLAVIGTALGSAFSADVLAQASGWLIPLAGLLAYICAAGAACYVYLRKVAGFDQPTAFFSGMPGGVVEMVELGVERGGDAKMIALIHAARIFLVVLCLPFLIEWLLGTDLGRGASTYVPLDALDVSDLGWFVTATVLGLLIGRLARLPAYFLLGPMLASAAMHASGVTDFTLPTIPLSLAQIVVGAAVGCRFVGTAPQVVLRVLVISLGATAILLCLTFVFSVVVARITGDPVEALLLAYSPGGIAEMSLIALSLKIEVAFVVFNHIARVFVVIASASAIFRQLAKRR
jgi:membrane AbrB-like protein